ncbi:MAG: D-alanyl-D-alanine carboxypeptidase, partial [Chloroflexota bacterium]|nr:D-alanyl-D-alanine carboxypeptidase [Chloroflexota bacterium]
MSWTAPGHPRPYDRRRRTTRAALLRLERIYLTLAALTCALVVATYVVAPRVAASSSGAFETADASRTDDAAATITQLGFFGGAITAGAPAVRAETVAPDDVVAGIPEWVQAIRATRLWADPTSDLAVASLPEWQYLHVVGVDQVWLRVEATLTDGPVSGWASLDDVGLSGPPPSWLLTLAPTTLFATSDGNETINSVPVGAAAMVWGPTKSGRISVYTPIDPTARRPGFGWLPVADVGPAPAPAGILLPSPQFHPMPIATDRVYRVVPGDTRASVAAGLGVDVPTLLAANDLAPSNSLLIGQILRLPPRPAAVAAASAPVKVRDIAPGWISPDMHGVVIDEASGEILWSRDPYSPVAPASLTKIVTALVTLDYARTTDRVRVDV